MLKLTALLLILSLADANTKWWCDTYIDKDLWSTIPVCANGGDDSVPAWCGNIAESYKGCVDICKIDSTPACDSTGNGINKIAFNDYFLKMNKNEHYKNIIRLSKCYTNSIDLKIVINK